MRKFLMPPSASFASFFALMTPSLLECCFIREMLIFPATLKFEMMPWSFRSSGTSTMPFSMASLGEWFTIFFPSRYTSPVLNGIGSDDGAHHLSPARSYQSGEASTSPLCKVKDTGFT